MTIELYYFYHLNLPYPGDLGGLFTAGCVDVGGCCEGWPWVGWFEAGRFCWLVLLNKPPVVLADVVGSVLWKFDYFEWFLAVQAYLLGC